MHKHETAFSACNLVRTAVVAPFAAIRGTAANSAMWIFTSLRRPLHLVVGEIFGFDASNHGLVRRRRHADGLLNQPVEELSPAA